MPIKYKLYQWPNEKSKYYQKWYAKSVVSSIITTDQIAERIQANSTLRKSDILAVLSELSEVIHNELTMGNRVMLDGIGSFKAGISSTPAETAKEWSVVSNIVGTHVIFRPETTDIITRGSRSRVAKMLLGATFEEMPEYARPGQTGSEGGETTPGGDETKPGGGDDDEGLFG